MFSWLCSNAIAHRAFQTVKKKRMAKILKESENKKKNSWKYLKWNAFNESIVFDESE